MNAANEVAAKMIAHSARALAGYAASELLEARPALSDDAASAALPRWQNLLADCLHELAAAVALDRPQLFADHVGWLQSLLAVRGVNHGSLQLGLECLGKILAAELPEQSAAAVEFCRRAAQGLTAEPAAPVPSLAADSVYGRLAGNYLLAILEGDRARAIRLILDAAEAGHPIRDLYLQVLMPAQQEGGRMWQDAEINVAEEHFATATTRAVMAQLRGRAQPQPANGKTLVTSAVTGNQHDLGLQAVSDFFELDGWRVIPLGCDMPIRDLVEAVGFYQADLLGLSVCLHSQLTTLQQTIAAVRQSERGATVKIVVGGRGLSGAGDLAAELGADGYAAGPVEAVALGTALVRSH